MTGRLLPRGLTPRCRYELRLYQSFWKRLAQARYGLSFDWEEWFRLHEDGFKLDFLFLGMRLLELIRKNARIGWETLFGPLLIGGPIGHRLANLAISLRYLRNTKLYVRAAGRAPNYIDPIHWTEKMQARKLFDHDPLFNILCDKLASRRYAEDADGRLNFPKIYWLGEDPEQIPFDDLPVPYVIKANHGSGRLIVVRDRGQVDIAAIRSQCRRWLKSAYGKRMGEWGYRDVRRKIYAEKFLRAPPGQLFPDDYKFVTFCGQVAWIEHVHDRGQAHNKTYFDREWRRMKFCRWQGTPDPLRSPLEDEPRPATLDRMIEIAEQLAKDTDHLRVDLYAIGEDIYFGEFTVYEESGLGVAFPEDEKFADFPSRKLDREMGDLWSLAPLPVSTKLGRALFGLEPKRD